MHHPTDRITHTSLCYTSRGALAGMRNNSMGPLSDLCHITITEYVSKNVLDCSPPLYNTNKKKKKKKNTNK